MLYDAGTPQNQTRQASKSSYLTHMSYDPLHLISHKDISTQKTALISRFYTVVSTLTTMQVHTASPSNIPFDFKSAVECCPLLTGIIWHLTTYNKPYHATLLSKPILFHSQIHLETVVLSTAYMHSIRTTL